MTRKLFRAFVAIALAGLTTLAPVAPTFGQAQAPGTITPPGGTPAQAPAQVPGQAPATPPVATPPVAQQPQPQGIPPAQSPTAPQAVPPFHFAAGRDYSQPTTWFPHVVTPYRQTFVPQPQLKNSTSIDQLVKDGKLMLSLQEAVELALENNLDIMVQRYYPWMAEVDLLRTRGGGADRGVGSTTLPTAFTNQLPLSFDPTLSTIFSIDSRLLPVNNPLTAGTGTTTSTTTALAIAQLFTHTGIEDVAYSQAFHEGTSFTASLDTTRTSTTSAAVKFNPSVQTSGEALLTQPLLNGFGFLVNERYLRIARINQKATDQAFMQSILTDITSVEDDYWELVYARDNVDVQRQAVDLAQRLYDDNKRQVEVGTLAPIEIIRAQAQVATAQQALIVAQTAQLQEQTLLMSVITKNPTAENLLNVEVVPTDSVNNLPPVENLSLVDAIKEALAYRPDVAEARLTINADDVNVAATHNALLPTLNLSAYVAGAGLNGTSRVTTPVPTVVPGGFGGSAVDTFLGQYPEYEAQLALTLPLRNRVAQADNARALLTQRQDQARLQQSVNNVMVDVQNALITLQQDRPTVTAAQLTRELQQETLDSDQKKLDLGASTIFVVVTDQQALAAAAAAEARAEANLAEAVVNLQRALGRTLDVFKITIADAKTGAVTRDTNIPGTTTTGQLFDPKMLSNQ
jgi:outer membrane protein